MNAINQKRKKLAEEWLKVFPIKDTLFKSTDPNYQHCKTCGKNNLVMHIDGDGKPICADCHDARTKEWLQNRGCE